MAKPTWSLTSLMWPPKAGQERDQSDQIPLVKVQGFVLAKVPKTRKPTEFEIRIAVLKSFHIHHNTSASQESHLLQL